MTTTEFRCFMAYTLELNCSHTVKKLPNTCCVTVAVVVVTWGFVVLLHHMVCTGENRGNINFFFGYICLPSYFWSTKLGSADACWVSFTFWWHRYFVEHQNNSSWNSMCRSKNSIKCASIQYFFFGKWHEFHGHCATSLSYWALPRLSLVKF